MPEQEIFQSTESVPVSTPQPVESSSVIVTASPENAPPPPPSVPPPLPKLPGGGGLSLGLVVKIVGGIMGFLVVIAIIFSIYSFFQRPKTLEHVTLTYWGLWEEPRIMDGIIKDFERQHSNITVQYIKQDPKQYRERVTTRTQNGTGPDVFSYHNTWLPQVKSLLLPLPTTVISPSDFKKNYYSVIQKDVVQNGAIYGIPIGIDTLSLYTNDDIFKAAGVSTPTDWNQFADTAKSLTVKDETGKIKTAGAAMGTFDNIAHAPDIIAMLFAQNGVDFANFTSTQDQASVALQFYTLFAGSDSGVWDDTLENSTNAFAKGSVAMYFGYSWDVFIIKAMNPQLQFSIHPVPALPGRNMTTASYWVEGVSSKSKHQKEAFEFLSYMTKSDTVQKLYTETAKTRFFGEPYAQVGLAESLKTNLLVYPFVQQAPNAISSYFAADTYDEGLNSRMNTYLGDAVRGIKASVSPQTAVEKLTQGVTQILGQYAGN